MNPIVDFFSYVLAVGVPYILAGQGMVVSGRAGVFVVFNEGCMLTSAAVTVIIGSMTGSSNLGLLAGIGSGLLFGLLLSIFSITYKQNQFVVGLALFVMGSGLASFIYQVYFGVRLLPPMVNTVSPINIPILSNIPYIGAVFFSQNILFYVAIAISLLMWFVLYKTRYGLIIRSIGESPRVADSLGYNVFLIQYIATLGGSALIAFAGAYLPLYFTGTYTDSITNGMGWIIIVLTLFGNWRPITVMLGAFVFSGAQVVSLYAQLLKIPVPSEFLLMIPFIVTLVIMIVTYRTAVLPKHLGRPYDRESLED